MTIREMTINYYEKVYELWAGTSGMGMRSLDDSYEGIERFLKRNPTTCFVAENGGEITGVILCWHDGRRGNSFWESAGFTKRDDLIYRNKSINDKNKSINDKNV